MNAPSGVCPTKKIPIAIHSRVRKKENIIFLEGIPKFSLGLRHGLVWIEIIIVVDNVVTCRVCPA